MTVNEHILITFRIKTEQLPRMKIVHLLFVGAGKAKSKIAKSSIKSSPEQGVATYKVGTLFKQIKVLSTVALNEKIVSTRTLH